MTNAQPSRPSKCASAQLWPEPVWTVSGALKRETPLITVRASAGSSYLILRDLEDQLIVY